MAPGFSVLVSAHQSAPTIAETLEGLLAQTVPAREIVVCDDGSTDDLDGALAPYLDRIRLIRKANGGGASALNAGAREASSEWVVICDSDDVYLPRRIEALGELAAARPELDIVTTDAWLERGGRIVGRFGEGTPFARERQREAILDRCFLFAPAVRRKRLLAVGGADEQLRIAYDWDLWMRLIHAGAEAGFVDEPLIRYRLREGSLADSRVAALRERVTVLDRAARRGGLSANEHAQLVRSRRHNTARWARAEADAALASRASGARARLLRAARAPGAAPHERARAAALAAAPRALWPRPAEPARDDGRGPAAGPVVALIPWGLAIEDFLDPTGVTLEAFASEFTGSWMFGWARAMRSAGLSPLLLCISRRERAPRRMLHAPTGTPILVVPASPAYRALAERMTDPYARDPAEAAPGLPAPLRSAARELAPYLAASPVALARAIRSERVAAVVCQEYEFPRFDVAVALGRVLRVPVYATFQGGDYQRWRLERILRPRTVPAAAGLLIGSRTEAERVRERYGATRVTRIPNPVDLEVWRPGDRAAARAALGLPADALVVAWHGRVSIDQKGLDVLAGAWRALAPRVPGAHLLLIGGGRDEAGLTRLLDGLPRVTRVADHMHDPAALAARLAAADVYVLPSRHEGLPVALAEAMACGLPAVATRVGGVEQLLPPAAGEIVAPEDPAALADALEGLLADADRRRAAGRAARAAAEAGFSLEAVGRALRAALGL